MAKVSSPKAIVGTPRFSGDADTQDQAGIDPHIFRIFQDLEIGVITDTAGEGSDLARDLQRSRARVNHIWPVPDQIPTTFDIVYCLALKDLPKRLPWSPGSPGAGLVLVLKTAQSVDPSLIENCAPHAVIHLPAATQTVLSSLVMAKNLYRYEQRLRNRINKLDENLRTMRSVERAKLILIQDKGYSEAEAYNFLRKQAMDRRTSIGALATAIVDSRELLG